MKHFLSILLSNKDAVNHYSISKCPIIFQDGVIVVQFAGEKAKEMIRDSQQLLARIRTIQAAIRDQVIVTCEQTAIEHLSRVVAEQAGDTIYALDRISEDILLNHFEQLGRDWSFVLIQVAPVLNAVLEQHSLLDRRT